jgi:MerR HTH family regulatory protein
MRSAALVADRYLVGDVARALDVTDEGVRYLARAEQLPCTVTPKGWRLFRRDDVLRLARRRDEARLRGVTRLRAKKVGPRGGPRQMSLFGLRRVK